MSKVFSGFDLLTGLGLFLASFCMIYGIKKEKDRFLLPIIYYIPIDGAFRYLPSTLIICLPIPRHQVYPSDGLHIHLRLPTPHIGHLECHLHHQHHNRLLYLALRLLSQVRPPNSLTRPDTGFLSGDRSNTN